MALNMPRKKRYSCLPAVTLPSKQKDYQKALKHFKEALLLDPEDDDLRANYELTLRKLQKQSPPAAQIQQNKDNQEQEAIRNILKGLDNKESTDRQQLKQKQSSKTDKWW
jgi:tetratricopeptide (TPR) repeat protein